jgi:formyltetrahydrofolate deformylase
MTQTREEKTAILVLSCPDRKGIVASVADFLLQNNANIVHSDQHQDRENQLFLARLEWSLDGFKLSDREFYAAFDGIAREFEMNWRLTFSSTRPRVAILVSKQDHCLVDLLYRHRSGELRCEIPLIVSNHLNTREIADFYRIPFYHIPIESGQGQREAVERRQIQLLEEYKIDLVVLARYMQILSPTFVESFRNKIINIHHSFLPAFLGARPYHRAFERGVKLIGATSHYVTEVLDDGAIIEQDVIRISHRDDVEDLIQKGRDLEKIVLSRAVRWHLENRIVLYGNKTVVFD